MSERLVGCNHRPEDGDRRGERRRPDVRAEREAAEREVKLLAGADAVRGEVRAHPDPREDDGAEGEVLLALEEQADTRRPEEDLLLQIVTVGPVQPCPDGTDHGDEPRRERDGQVDAAPGVAQEDRRMNERGSREPPEVAVKVLDEAERFEHGPHFVPKLSREVAT